jgi:peptidyl-prolyl cis-trans isomerase C
MSLIASKKQAACAVAALFIAAGSAAYAQDAAPAPGPDAPAAATAAPAPAAEPNPDDVVARVAGEEVTERDLKIVRDALSAQLANVPADQQRSVLIDTLVNMEMLAKAARDEGLDKTEDYAAELAFLEMQALRNAYVEHAVVNAVTDEEMQQSYQTLIVAEHKPEEEIRARHILVETKEEAEKIIEELKGGASFEELAKQSKDPSGQNGGDLGFFRRGQMVAPFEEAAFALSAGEMTEEPVESQFGWHVIRVEEKRMSEPPSFAEVEGELRNYLTRQKFETVLTALRDKYDVEVIGAPDEGEGGTSEEAPAEGGEAPAEGAAPAEQPAQ